MNIKTDEHVYDIGATGLASYINDTYTVAQPSTKTTRAGAGTLSVRDGMYLNYTDIYVNALRNINM